MPSLNNNFSELAVAMVVALPYSAILCEYELALQLDVEQLL
jgi:hypothetical protein